jgi:hypothetical protein
VGPGLANGASGYDGTVHYGMATIIVLLVMILIVLIVRG